MNCVVYTMQTPVKWSVFIVILINGGFKALHLNYNKLFYKGTQKQGTPALERY